MDERLRFVARLLEGEKMAPLCREFGISRKTGYKIFERYKRLRARGLTDRSRRPYRQANRLPVADRGADRPAEARVSGWGAPKIREKLRHADQRRALAGDQHGACGARSPRPGPAHGRGRRYRAAGTTALAARPSPTRLWCADYKGEFMLADRRYCYPLTITDFASRYLLTCEALSTTQEAFAFTVFERAFKEFGLPQAIRTDNGVPFASPNALYRPQQALGLVAAPGHRDRAHQAGPPAAERPPRAHAPDPEEGGHQTGRAATCCSSRPGSTTSSTATTTSGRTRRSA